MKIHMKHAGEDKRLGRHTNRRGQIQRFSIKKKKKDKVFISRPICS